MVALISVSTLLFDRVVDRFEVPSIHAEVRVINDSHHLIILNQSSEEVFYNRDFSCHRLFKLLPVPQKYTKFMGYRPDFVETDLEIKLESLINFGADPIVSIKRVHTEVVLDGDNFARKISFVGQPYVPFSDMSVVGRPTFSDIFDLDEEDFETIRDVFGFDLNSRYGNVGIRNCQFSYVFRGRKFNAHVTYHPFHKRLSDEFETLFIDTLLDAENRADRHFSGQK